MKKTVLRCSLLPLLFGAAVMGADKPKGLSTASPFTPAGTGAVAASSANENIEFAGVTTVGKRTDLVFYDKVAKKSHWLAKGEEKAGITLLNYDPQREQAVVKVNGIEKVLTLRKGHGAIGAARTVAAVPTGFNINTPSTAPAPVTSIESVPATIPVVAGPAGGAPGSSAPTVQPAPAPSGPPTPQTQARQETEARMLVSDLLEIGMAQRRAYEEAQRKAAEGTPANPPPTSTDKPAGP